MESTQEYRDAMAMLEQVEKLVEMATTMGDGVEKNNIVTSFVGQLGIIAGVLRENSMPQATINIVLAARCGLPMQKLDPRSMCVRWTEDDPSVEQ